MAAPRPAFLSDPNYSHDDRLGHAFFAITGRTDQCNYCGCQVSDATNRAGEKGGRFDEECRDQPWRCDGCGKYHPHNAPVHGFPDVLCRDCQHATARKPA